MSTCCGYATPTASQHQHEVAGRLPDRSACRVDSTELCFVEAELSGELPTEPPPATPHRTAAAFVYPGASVTTANQPTDDRTDPAPSAATTHPAPAPPGDDVAQPGAPTATRRDLQLGRRLLHLANGVAVATAYAFLFTQAQVVRLFGI